MSNRAWVTLATNDSYGLGALVLAHSLRRTSSVYPAVVLITPSVTEPMRERLRAVYAEVVVVDVLDSRDAAHLALLQRPELGITFTKIHCWNLTQFEKCVFLDADTLVIQNCDELFEREELSAAPDVGWPDCFNSGVFVFRPSGDTFSNLVKFASERGSFDGGDQGLLNSFFSDWAHGDINKHLPFLYNVTSAAFYSYIPALKHYGQNLKIIHFIGAVKPWLQQYNWESRSVQAPEHLKEFLQLWWDLFVAQVHAQLDTNMDEGYIEEPEPVIYHHEEAIEYNKPIVQQFGFYEPSLDSESEFPWHHPENQVFDTEVNAPQIDMSEFFDPWNIYGGNIPPNKEDSGQAEQTDDYENMRKYAWDYVPPQHSQHQIEVTHNYGHLTQPQHYTNISERITQPHHHEIQNDNHSAHHSHNPPQQHNWQCNTEHSQNVSQPSEYTPSWPQSSYDHNYKQDSHTHTSSHEFDYYNLQHNYSQHHNDFQQHQKHQEQPIQHSYSQSDHHSTQSHRDPYYPQEHHYDNRDFHEEKHEHPSQNQNETLTNNHVSYSVDTEQNQITKKHNHMNDFTYLQLKNPNREEQIYTVMMDHVRMRTESLKVNGYESDSESDLYDDISPRHPYDGFYLRHRMTIDSRGRKICSHEIPYIPRSPSPGSSDDFEDALEYTPEEDSIVNGEDMQTGVAGNLARVVPGAPLQREAVDELSRRQGWEAGNIDYMGADSFDNIWAKISQTLSQSPDQDSEPQASQEEAIPVSSEQAPIEPEPVVEKESVSEVPAEKVAEVPVETKKVPEEVPELESEKPSVAQSEPAALPTPAEAPLPSEDIEVPVPASEAAEVKPEEPIPVPAESAAVEVPAESPSVEAQPEPAQEIPVAAVEALKIDEPAPSCAESESAPVPAPEPAAPEPAAPEPEAPESAAPEPAVPAIVQPAAAQEPEPAAVSESIPEVVESKPEEPAKAEPASESPPLANTPSKEEIPAAPAAKSERRKLQLPPPAADALPTPDSEHEDAAALAHAIIASELRASPTSPAAASASPVSLSQIGVKPKPSTAAQIESSVPKQPKPKAEGDPPKKKIIKKVVKKEASGDTPVPVPPPRKKEKKPKEK